jgi:tetratricopeptide (TPR) repeat protein
MQPLTPNDLIIRPTAEDQSEAKVNAAPPVSLERYQELERTIRDIPLYVDPYFELADIYTKAKRWADARRVLEIAVTRFPEDQQAAFLYEESQLSRSSELAAKAEAEHRSEPTQLTLDALQRCQLELNVLREKVYRARLNRNPQQIELLIPLADALDRLDQHDEAIRSLKQASDQPSLRAEASLQLGKMLERAQRVPEALSAYRRAALFRVPPPSQETKYAALFAAADLALRSGMIDSGRRYLEMLLELSPHNAALKQRLADLRPLPL